MQTEVEKNMQHYVGQKLVQAEAIASWSYITDDKVQVNLANGDHVTIPSTVFARDMPTVGDYLVRYADGYWSWSPRKVFEDSYHQAAGGQLDMSAPLDDVRHLAGRAILWTDDDKYVATVAMPPYSQPPDVLMWGSRYFQDTGKEAQEPYWPQARTTRPDGTLEPERPRPHYPLYRECFMHIVLPGQTLDQKDNAPSAAE